MSTINDLEYAYYEAALGGTLPPAEGTMTKDVYDKNDNGIVDSAERIEDTVILSEDVAAGSLVYITDAPASAEGLASVGNADAYDPVRRPAVGIALEAGTVSDEIRILEYGLLTGVDTSSYTNSDILYLGRTGEFTDVPNAEYAEQIGSVYEADVDGSIIFQRGSIETAGVKWSYSTQAGADTLYETTAGGNVSRAVITQDIGQSRPQAKNYLIFNDDVVTQPIDTDTLVNPAYTITPTESNEILGFVIKPAADQTNVTLTVNKGVDIIWRQSIGDITNGVEKVIDLTTGSYVPIDVSEAGVNYGIAFTSKDGDVEVLGDAVSGKPYYRTTYWEYENIDLVSSTVPIDRETVLSAASTATSQEPSAVDTPIQIEFGPAQNTPSDPVQIDALGAISINTSDTYTFSLGLQYGRLGAAGVSVIYARTLINGVQVGTSGYARIDDSNVTVPTSNEIELTLAAGDVVTFELLRDSTGNNSGGLFLGDPTLAGWADAPTAEVVVTRYVGQGVLLPTQGDVTGPGVATQNEIATYANATGKEIKATSDYTAEAGTIKRIGAGTASLQHSNGLNKLNLTGTTAQLVAKNAVDNSTTTWTLNDSNGGQFGGSAINVDSASGSVGYKSSQNGNFKNQMYWNSVEDLTHVSHKGSTATPNADIIMDDTSITTEFSGAEAMGIDSNGHLSVNGADPQVSLDSGGTPEYTWQDVNGTMRLGVDGFVTADDSWLEMEAGFTTLKGGDAGFARLKSGNALVVSDGTSENVEINSNTFGQGDDFIYPTTDGLDGDRITTDGSGNLTLDTNNFEVVSATQTIEVGDKDLLLDAGVAPFTLTLADNPRVGERKRFYIGDNSNDITLQSANPAFPIFPLQEVARDALEVAYDLDSTTDRSGNGRDLAIVGTGGAYVPLVVNGDNVTGRDFQGTSAFQATGYKGVTGGDTRTITMWYRSNTIGNPTTTQQLTGWGTNAARARYDYRLDANGIAAGITTVNRVWGIANLNAVNLFDGNLHHIAIRQNSNTSQSIDLFVDGQLVPPTSTISGTFATGANRDLRVGDGVTDSGSGGQYLDGVLFDYRLFSRALSDEELTSVRDQRYADTANLSRLQSNTAVDCVFNGNGWVLDAYPAITVEAFDGRITDLENTAMLGVDSSVENAIVTYDNGDGKQATNLSGVTVVDGAFDKASGDISFDTPLLNVTLNDTTGNITMHDGGDGDHNLFFGRHRMRNPSDSPGIFLENSGGATLGGMIWEDAGTGYLHHWNGTSQVTPDSEMRLYGDELRVSAPTIVNSTEAITAQGLQINDEFSDAGQTTYYEDVPLMVNLLTDNGGNTPSAPATAMSLHRSGVPNEAYGNSARFDLSRYETAGTDMRTQMDIRLGHAQPITTGGGEDDNTPTILSMRSNGEVSMPTTDAAFKPPRVTTTQRNAITPEDGSFLYDTDLNVLFFGDGASWIELTGATSVVGKTAVQNGISLSGVFQGINSGAFNYFDINGSPATPNFTGGVWTCPATGTYQINISGLAFTGAGSETQARVYTSINGNNYTNGGYDGIDQVTKNGSGLAVNGQVRLNAGDTVQIGYSVLSGTGWQLDNFRWDLARVI